METSKGDPDVFMKREVRDDKTEYYSYLVIYVNDILCVNGHPKRIMNKLGSVYRLKDGSVETPERYLGIDIKSWTIEGDDCTITECLSLIHI